MNLFWKYGYEGTSLSALTVAMGITAPSLYGTFKCKEALFRAAVEYYAATDGSGALRALQEQPTAYVAIQHMLLAAARLPVLPDMPRGCLVVLGATNCTPANEEIGHYLKGCRRSRSRQILRRLKQGVADGDLPAAADIRSLAAVYTTVLHGLAIQARDGATGKSLKAIARAAMLGWPMQA
jgi:AcrR family transcriptional regulator